METPENGEAQAPEKGDNGQRAPESPAQVAAETAVEKPEDRLSRLEREKAEAHERMLRVAADFENYKKRVKRTEDEAGVRAREALLREILPVLDNLERATQAVGKGGSLESLAQGVKLVDKQLHGALEKFQVKGFDALGQPFDPARHEAIQQMETTEYPPGSVAMVFARGYTIGERLLRPAMVAVAKAPAVASEEPGEREDATEEIPINGGGGEPDGGGSA